jgi:hypothetical protein
MLKILGLFFSIVLIVFGISMIFEDDSLTRESVIEERDKTIIIHKKQKVKRITEIVDTEYKKNHNLDYY